MKWFKAFVFTLALGLFGAIYFVPGLRAQFLSHVYFSYCDSPIHYKVDSIDSRFGLSKQSFENDTAQAAQVWDRAQGKELFVYDPKGDLSVNLTYDSRQALDTQIGQIQNQLNNQQSNLTPELQQYNQESASFNNQVQSFKSEVDYWNLHGGALPDEFQKLQNEQASLKTEADNLNQMAKNLNLSADQYNQNINKYNQTVNAFNKALSQKPEEGLFDGPKNRIDIYFDNSQTELIHTLSHELGHSLGMGHNDNPNSIMYPYTNQIIVPSKDDLAALSDVCKKHSIFEGIYIRFQQIFNKTG